MKLKFTNIGRDELRALSNSSFALTRDGDDAWLEIPEQASARDLVRLMIDVGRVTFELGGPWPEYWTWEARAEYYRTTGLKLPAPKLDVSDPETWFEVLVQNGYD